MTPETFTSIFEQDPDKPDPFDWAATSPPATPLPFSSWSVLMVGRIALAWSVLELALDQAIEELAKQRPAEPLPDGWKRHGFNKRRALCGKLVAEVIQPPNGLRETMFRILAEIKDLGWRRNALVHGKLVNISPQFRPDTPVEFQETVRVHWTDGSKDVQLDFTIEAMHSIYYGITHLSGWLLYLNSIANGPPIYVPGDLDRRVKGPESE